VAFIQDNFVLLDEQYRVVPITTAHHCQDPKHMHEIHIHFRLDKSRQNLTIRKFKRRPGFLWPIDATISILIRATKLGVHKRKPLGVFLISPAGHCTYIQSQNVIDNKRQACKLAYPDCTPFLRVNIALLVDHSNSVTAAVSLCNMGFSIGKKKKKKDLDLRRCPPDSV
jgi:hypothetical protein